MTSLASPFLFRYTCIFSLSLALWQQIKILYELHKKHIQMDTMGQCVDLLLKAKKREIEIERKSGNWHGLRSEKADFFQQQSKYWTKRRGECFCCRERGCENIKNIFINRQQKHPFLCELQKYLSFVCCWRNK